MTMDELEQEAKNELASEEKKIIKEKLKEKMRQIFQTTLQLKLLNSEFEDLKNNYQKNGIEYFSI